MGFFDFLFGSSSKASQESKMSTPVSANRWSPIVAEYLDIFTGWDPFSHEDVMKSAAIQYKIRDMVTVCGGKRRAAAELVLAPEYLELPEDRKAILLEYFFDYD